MGAGVGLGAHADDVFAILAQTPHQGGGVQVVVAPSAAGKSSLLHAGLLPQLARDALPGSSRWPTIAFTPTAHPLTAPAIHIAALTDADPAALAEKLAADSPSAGRVLSQALRRRLGGENPETRVVVVVDQFEELFTLCTDDQQRRAFIDEPGLVELLLRDLGDTAPTAGQRGMTSYEAGRLPLLAHALRATWQQRHGHTLTVEGYRSTGGIHHAVATTTDRVFTGLDPTGQQAARMLFLRLIKIGDGTEDTRRRVARRDLLRGLDPGSMGPVVDAFTRGRLLTQGQDTVEIPTRHWCGRGRGCGSGLTPTGLAT